MKKIGLLEVLEGIEDSRRERSVWYPLHEVLFIFIAAVLCGATSYVKVEMFGKSKEKWLKKYIKCLLHDAFRDNVIASLLCS